MPPPGNACATLVGAVAIVKIAVVDVAIMLVAVAAAVIMNVASVTLADSTIWRLGSQFHSQVLV